MKKCRRGKGIKLTASLRRSLLSCPACALRLQHCLHDYASMWLEARRWDALQVCSCAVVCWANSSKQHCC